MPLVRYEVRCEHSLANPELYRATEQDDSEGLLEGVAMAGLVGLVRQLGDLAEFAAEIFHDLHDDIIKIVARGQSVKERVTRLEADLPQVEKALLAKANQFKFCHTARSKWRAPLPMDQSVCGQGELPRFVQTFYDDCRGPPRLFLLDKFDGGGRGACVKRYTDPTFFRLTWATSQLERAEQLERERQEHFEQLEAQKIQKQSSMKKGSKLAGSVYPRERLSSAHFENLEGFTGNFTPELRSMRLDPLPEGGDLTPDEPQSPVQQKPPKQQQQQQQLPEVDEGPVLAPLKISAKDIESAKRGRRMQTPTSEDDGASDYVDAMTTMGSDADSELGRWSARNSARLSADSAQSPMPVEWEHFEAQPVYAREVVPEPAVTTPRSRRQWEKDNASSLILSMADIESLSLRERLVESTEASSSRALVPEQETELRTRGYASSPSSPYTVVSSSTVMDDDDDDGFTSESARSSPKAGPSFSTLMSPPESPPPRHGLMGSPISSPRAPPISSPRAPPIIPLLSTSPLMSRSSSVKHDPTGASSAEISDKIKGNHVIDPSENGGSKPESRRSPDQTSALPNAVTRPRTWVDRSEINVAATLRAIRQAAAVGSDDDTASECRSEAGS